MDRKIELTAKYVARIAAAPKGTRIDYWDSVVKGFGVRVTDSGAMTYNVLTRLDGKQVRRTIGPVGRWTLKAARLEAQKLNLTIAKGDDPKELKRKAVIAKGDAFELVLEEYIDAALGHLKNRDEVASMLRREFGAPWKGRPIATIKTKDVADRLLAKKVTKPAAAQAMLAKITQFFKWTISRGLTEFTPCYAISSTSLLGNRKRRKHVLTDADLVKVWNGALSVGYPLGPIVLMIILTGLRLNAVVGARRSEFDLKAKLWTIPAERMKGKGDDREAFAIPLTPQMIDLLNSLPRFNEGDHLFSINNGMSPIHWRIEHANTLRTAAKLFNWRNHDLRRTMRTRLEAHPINMSHIHAEAMIAHKQSELGDIYNQYKYPREMREGFLAWNAEVVRITGGLPKRLQLVA